MSAWRWVGAPLALAVHDRQLAEHGGGEGVRDMGLLESALARPQNAAAYGEPDVAELAAAYAYGIAKNHPFVDGNKRTAFVVSVLFLLDNGYRLTADDVDAVATFLALAEGTLGEADLTEWFRANLANIG